MFFKLIKKLSIPLILTLEVFTISFVFSISIHAQEKKHHSAEAGLLDLTGWDHIGNPIIRLDGEWLSFPGMSAEEVQASSNSSKEFITIPSYMTSAVIPRKNRHGLFTYRLKIELPPGEEHFTALAMENITPNYRLFINGEELCGAGTVSADPNLSRSGNNPFLIPLRGDSFDIVISVSNYHNIAGGINRSLLFGDYTILSERINIRILLDSFALGSLFIISFYSLFLFSVNKRKRSFLYLSFICMIALVFSGLKGQMILVRVLPFLGGELRTKLIFICLCNIGGAVYLYTSSLKPRMKFPGLRIFFLTFMPAGSLLALLTPMKFYTDFVLIYEVLGLGSLVVLLAAALIKFPRTVLKESNLLFLIIFAFCSITLIGILDDATIIPFSSISLSLLLVILTIIIVQAWEYNHAISRMGKIMESRKQLARANRELRKISHMDSLTGVANRRLLDQYINEHGIDGRGQCPALIMADIDYFKYYNDHFGHQEGDSCLSKIAAELKSCLHRQGDFIARYGGEEFAIILQNLDRDGIQLIAEKMRKKIEDLEIPHPGSQLPLKTVTISLGCAACGEGSKYTLKELISMADSALYEAKHRGRNRVCFVDEPHESTEDSEKGVSGLKLQET